MGQTQSLLFHMRMEADDDDDKRQRSYCGDVSHAHAYRSKIHSKNAPVALAFIFTSSTSTIWNTSTNNSFEGGTKICE